MPQADESAGPPHAAVADRAGRNCLASLTALFAASAALLPLPDRDAVERSFRPTDQFGPLSGLIYDQIRAVIASSTPDAAFDTHNLRRLGVECYLAQAVGQGQSGCDAVVDAILAGLEAGTALPPLEDGAWPQLMDLGRGLVTIETYRHVDARLTVVAEAGARLARDGYNLEIADGAYAFAAGELERAVENVRVLLAEFGQFDVLRQILRILQETDQFGYGMYLPVRDYSWQQRSASYPFGMLVNLAAKLPFQGSGASDPNASWRKALDLARDVVAALNLEPYNAFGMIDPAPRRLTDILREAALFDHLFAFRQWPFDRTAEFLSAFFANDHDQAMRDHLGWTIPDVVTLLQAIAHFSARDPIVFTESALVTGGIPRQLLRKMLPYFAHPNGQANLGYDSPLAAERANLMFKPLLHAGDDRYLLPAAPLAGPAFYEATIGALRSVISADAANELTGVGTERLVHKLLQDAGLNITVAGVAYNLGSEGAGECDFVVESDTFILLVECKAKPLTRGAMAGVPGDALLDFAGGMFAAQVQALRHERILRTRGQIDFLDGTRPLVRGTREISRLSITLLDHGALQDRLVLWSMYDVLTRSTVQASSGYKKASQARKLAGLLDELRYEVSTLEGIGISARQQALSCASLSVASLAVLLTNVKNLDHFIDRATKPATYMSYNPVFEFYHMEKAGLVR